MKTNKTDYTPRKIRVALFVPWLKSKGGVERVILNILKDEHCRFDVYTFDYESDRTFEGFKKYKIHVMGRSKNGSFLFKGIGLFFNLISHKIKNLEKYDIFLISTGGIAEFTVFKNKHRNTVALTHTPLRAAHTMYGYYKNSLKYKILLPPAVFLYRLLEKRAWRHIDHALVLSDEVKTRLIKYGLIKSDKIFKLGPQADYSEVKSSKKNEKIILYASRFIPYKRQDLAIKAFKSSSLKEKGFKLVLGGFIEDRAYFERLKKLAYADDSVIIKTDLTDSDLKKLYSASYATLFLAINEDTGLVPLESLAYGKPVISVNEGGPREFIKNNINGILVQANEKSIARALDRIADKKLYKKLRSGALNSPKYDEKKWISNFNNALDSILAWEKKKA